MLLLLRRLGHMFLKFGAQLGQHIRDRAAGFAASACSCRIRFAPRQGFSQKRSDHAAEGKVIDKAEVLKAAKAFAVDNDQCGRPMHFVGRHRRGETAVLPVNADRETQAVLVSERG